MNHSYGNILTGLFLSAVAGIILLTSISPAIAADETVSDEFIAGYATAIIHRELQLQDVNLKVDGGVITLEFTHHIRETRDRIKSALSRLKGVKKIVIVVKGKENSGETQTAGSDKIPLQVKSNQDAEQVRVEIPPDREWKFLPKGDLFPSLMADPRWPHFSATYQNYIDNRNFENIGAVTFGETIPFARKYFDSGKQLQIGLHAAVFAIFDLDADSKDLVNADYWISFPAISYRNRGGDFSALLRFYHQSSHLGDEFILRTEPNRVNLSYEAINLLLSKNLSEWFRIYGGAEYILHKEPSDLEEWTVQYGAEFQTSPWKWNPLSVRYVAAIDIKNQEEGDWEPNISVRTGFQLEKAEFPNTNVKILLEYFNGRSPNGQFYDQTIEYWGIGIHSYF
jgi:hypothetical protein